MKHIFEDTQPSHLSRGSDLFCQSFWGKQWVFFKTSSRVQGDVTTKPCDFGNQKTKQILTDGCPINRRFEDCQLPPTRVHIQTPTS